MAELTQAKGQCLCGSVEIAAATMSQSVGACHCSTCRKWGGGPLFAVDCHTDVKFSGEESISSYASSDWAERGFCTQCGTHLFFKLKGNSQYIIPVGLFDDGLNVVFDHQVFIEEKPEYYDFSNPTKELTGEELFAQFSPE